MSKYVFGNYERKIQFLNMTSNKKDRGGGHSGSETTCTLFLIRTIFENISMGIFQITF